MACDRDGAPDRAFALSVVPEKRCSTYQSAAPKTKPHKRHNKPAMPPLRQPKVVVEEPVAALLRNRAGGSVIGSSSFATQGSQVGMVIIRSWRCAGRAFLSTNLRGAGPCGGFIPATTRRFGTGERPSLPRAELIVLRSRLSPRRSDRCLQASARPPRRTHETRRAPALRTAHRLPPRAQARRGPCRR